MSFARVIMFVLLLLASKDAGAQEPISPSRIAVHGDYWFGTPLTFDRASPILRHFNTSGVGTSKDHSYGAAIEFAWDLSPDWRVHFQGGGRVGQGAFRSSAFALTEDQLRRTYVFAIETDYIAVDLGLHASHRLLPLLEALAGTTLSFYPASSAIQIRSSVDGLSPQIIDTAARGDILLSKPIHVSIPVGLRLTLDQGRSYSAGIDLMAGINMTEAIRGYVSQSFRVGGGVWVAFGESRVDDATSVVGSHPVPVLPRLHADSRFVVNGRAADSVSVVMIDTTITASSAIPQYLYFSADHANTPIAGLPDISDPLMTIVERMRDKPDAKLTIELRRSVNESLMIHKERATMLSRLFAALGGRTTIDTSQAPLDGAAYAMLKSSDPGIFLPVRTKVTNRVARVDQLSVERSVIAEGGVDRWSVAVLNNTDTLVAYGSETPGTNEAEGFSFSIPASRMIGHPASRLLLHSFVMDRTGQRVDSYDTLYVRTTAEAPRQFDVAEYLLLNQPPVPGQTWSYESSMMDLIVGSIDNASLVEVTNVSDPGVRYVADVVSKIMAGASARGVLPRKIEALPKSSGLSGQQSHTYSNAVRVKVVSSR